MASLSNPVNVNKLLATQLAAQKAEINAHVDSKTTETKAHITSKSTDTKNHVTSKASATDTLLNTETQAIDVAIDNISKVNGQLDSNVAAINAHTTQELSNVSVLPKLAPDAGHLGAQYGGAGYFALSGFDASNAMTTILSLTGKFSIPYMKIVGLTAETLVVKLTIDGEVIWNETFTCSSTLYLFGELSGDRYINNAIQCDSSLVFEIQTLTDTSAHLYYLARPIK